MKPDLAIRLLHQCRHATLATQSQQYPGYPYASAIQYICDERQRPIFVASALAEHSKNLQADPHISLSFLAPGDEAAQSAERMTILGEVERFDASASLRERLLRYIPEAEEWLALDFMFFRLQPKRLRLIAGLGKMGWIDEGAWMELPALALDRESALLEEAQPALPASIRLLGCDYFGADLLDKGHYRRADWEEAASDHAQIRECLLRLA
ncbi:HugZ family protein [Chromobacterium sp. IIBBL 290-4]|uniref:HugZ family pyridoxamine 5'-phosphate oxidase n=1 Tax=Chromobacterium sp. IIBBL 290-4 TaxID=2953890 RepID=UPI0020B8774F|nr:CREG family protein [Chromobacterium sp. IIBBL 290-4]UTH73087.1 CREG family protein [Chromobacterium sp. IIBBL 290-4]